MNFQTVSTAQKLPTSDGQAGGYDSTGTVPGPVLSAALDYTNDKVAALESAISRSGHAGDTAVILSAKHGQSPMDSRALRRIDDGTVIDALDAAWKKQHPGAAQPLVAASLNDDGMLLWFSNGNRTPQAAAFASRFLAHYSGNGTGSDGTAKATTLAGQPVGYNRAGLQKIYAGDAAARYIGTAKSDPRVPDLIGLAQHGVVYTGGTSKIAEHGGDDPQDRNVPLVVSGPGINHVVRRASVETTGSRRPSSRCLASIRSSCRRFEPRGRPLYRWADGRQS
ncbi:MAG TPA: hypothetical protein VLR26_17610 [Frankiaceae bacterium]|nr:hypothetical protein [Frankiaceae bacterium]